MTDIIQLLPDSVANQIAAGEVIQRPASVVKELVENAIDAGAKRIQLIIKGAGRTLVQVIDDGAGMSQSDARLAFERHATSKIKKAEDLFSIRTMGFRGEALASIAAVAQVELKTRPEDEELGTHIIISGSEIEAQEFISCPQGSNFIAKNLFFNIPARRRFLKSDNTELRHILVQFQRIVLCYPEIAFSLKHNDSEIYNLPVSNHQQRILHVFGNNIGQNLVPVDVETSLVKIKGYIGKPELAKKKSTNQFFFVNKRFMRHAYFHKAVTLAYENLIPPNTQPAYFLYFDIDPDKIDINIHPTKTEIKFEDSPAVFQMVRASVKEALGKFNIIPSIDFDQEGAIDIPVLNRKDEFNSPQIGINPNYNPFETEKESNNQYSTGNYKKQETPENWESLYQGIENEGAEQKKLFNTDNRFGFNDSQQTSNIFHLKGKYIVTPVKSGLMLINKKRAHERILYEQFLSVLEDQQAVSQISLFPTTLNLDPENAAALNEIKEQLQLIGYDIQNFGKNTFVINASPAFFENMDPTVIIEQFLENYKNTEGDIEKDAKEKMAFAMAKAAAIDYHVKLTSVEMRELIDALFTCNIPNFSPSGKLIVRILNMDELEKMF
ncbi:MAG: DNA mismatch repair endonuclease MutL [Bacteroidota bacterium]